MVARNLPEQSFLLQCFDYNPETGVLRWRVRPREHFKADHVWKRWNTRYAGTEPMATSGPKRYRRCDIGKKRYYLQRVIWKLLTNEEPPEVDHRNGDHSDFRKDNLRAATRQQNARNMRRHINKTYLKGTRPSPTKGKWLAAIRAETGPLHLGTFDTEQEAHAAYVAAAQRLFGEFWRAS
jgi:hypothetical protein